jgi:hypothetical protein
MPGPSRNHAAPNSRGHRRPIAASQRAALVDLPAAGTDLPVPPMPDGRDWSDAERARWDELWRSPQSCMWDDSARGTVAALIVFETAILDGSATAWQAAEARHASEALGLTPRAMANLGWRIAE